MWKNYIQYGILSMSHCKCHQFSFPIIQLITITQYMIVISIGKTKDRAWKNIASYDIHELKKLKHVLH